MKRLQWIWEGDGYLRVTILMAMAASLASFVYFYSQGVTLLYVDAESHLMIAKRVVGSLTPGFAQLGGTWLPLPHILMLPFVWNDFMYWSGLAGSIVSMISFVLATVFIYKIALLLTEDKGAGLIAAFIFAINPNILYMQSTPMGELLLTLFVVAAIYCLIKWSQDINKLQYLFATALAVFLATLTRYDGWGLLLAVVAVLLFISIRNHFDYHKIEGHLVYFGTLAGFGIFLWLLWCQVILGDFLYSQRGKYSYPVTFTADPKIVGNLYLATLSYGFAILENIGIVAVLLGTLGFLYFLFSERLNLGEKASATVLLFPIPFYIILLYRGQSILQVPEIVGSLYNYRVALLIVVTTALFAGYLTQKRIWLKALVVIGITAGTMMMFHANNIVTLNDPLANRAGEISIRQATIAQWLSQNYDGGFILMENFRNELVVFESRIPMGKFIYEGSYKYWEPALENPQDFAKWVFMRGGITPDKVWKALHSTPQLLDNYDLVYQNGGIEIYKRKPTL